ncbi:ferredoxin reductase [Acrocarpospora macrocephala]|uniref:Putative oxidoreductase n=1 Tax=Acrocarpospora macrocephala TaxID=150177 RepID=A0A5M3WC44_9ACTN|nr:ferredoxin reductase [Acrocarpospora macrocephala]GES06416.1 putative oxidoreductase [Acrocarpospora macrocephala]
MSAEFGLPGPTVLRRLAKAAHWLSTPLLPEDYLGLLDPLWSAEELRGRVEGVYRETADAATLVIRPGRGWSAHRPGQWVRIGVDIQGRRHWRTYSLSSPPERPDGCFTITVKAIPDGLVSNHLARRTAPGTIVRLAGPEGEFVVPEPPPPRLLFLTAGSGITPVMAILSSLLAGETPTGTGRSSAEASPAGAEAVHPKWPPVQERRALPDVVLVHSAPTPQDVIFGERLRHLAARSPYLRLYERHTRSAGRLRPADLAGLCPDWAQRSVWACGPAAMLDEVVAHWTGPEDRLHIEHFRPTVLTSGGEGGRVRFTKTGREADADGVTPLLTVGEDTGVLMPSGCRMGICHSCVGRLRSGRVRDLRTGQVHGEAGDLIQTCVSAAAGPIEIEL